MRRSVKRQTPLVAAGQVRLVGQNRPQMLGAAATVERRGQLHLKMNQQRFRRVHEQRPRGGIFNRSTAQRQHQRFFAGQPRNRGALPLAERGLAFPRKDLRNGCSRPRPRSRRPHPQTSSPVAAPRAAPRCSFPEPIKPVSTMRRTRSAVRGSTWSACVRRICRHSIPV